MIGVKELSKNNPWHLPKLRYLELKNYCFQYEDWSNEASHLCCRMSIEYNRVEKHTIDPDKMRVIENDILKVLWYYQQIDTVKRAMADVADGSLALSKLLYGGVIKNKSYDIQIANDPILIIITRREYYEAYRKFFYILDKIRKEQDNACK